MTTAAVLAAIPSPTRNVWYLGPLPIRAYALCIIAGIVAAVYLTERRLRARGGPAGLVTDIAVWAVPAGIVGARIYHVLTSPDAYFGEGGDPLAVFEIWNGGLGIWGAIAGGAFGSWIACRQRGVPLRVFGDALAPGLAIAQALGRLGNWFNNELYGRPTDLPWGLEVHRMDALEGRAVALLPGTYHPTFLYEALWCLGVAALVWWADRRFRLGGGRVFALYVMAYTAGRLWIEALRIDPAEMFFAGKVDFLGPWFADGIRLNVLTSVLVFLGGLAYFVLRRVPRERLVTDEDGHVTVVPDDGTPVEAPETEPEGVVTEPDAAVTKSDSGRATGERPSPRVNGAESPDGTLR